jgi:hypothetical protein
LNLSNDLTRPSFKNFVPKSAIQSGMYHLASLRVLALVLALTSVTQASATTYRWIDQNGKVQYSDTMPPNQAGQGHAELDKQGRVVKEIKRTRMSEEERKQQAALAAIEAAKKREQEAMRRRDQALLATYTSEKEIELARNRAIELENLNVRGLKTRLDAAANKLGTANAGLARSKKMGQPDHAGHTQMRNEAQQELIQITEAIRMREAAIANIQLQSEKDTKRFLELKSTQQTQPKR